MNNNKPLLLVGMMGTGKSTLGTMLAQRLSLDFYDSDEIIVENEGQTIPEIFNDSQKGEAYFRQIEAQIIMSLINKNERSIVATGGGAVTSKEMMAYAKSHAFVVWLKSPAEEIYNRIKKDRNRPLLQVADPLKTLEDILSKRHDLYAQAHISLDLDDEQPLKTLDQLIALYKDN